MLTLRPLSSSVSSRVTPRLLVSGKGFGGGRTWVYQLTVNKTVVKPQLKALGTGAGRRRCEDNIPCSFCIDVSPPIYPMYVSTMINI